MVKDMPSQTALNAVLNSLQGNSFLPSQLIERLLSDGNLSESDLKEAIAQLLHDDKLELTPDRHLHVVAATAA
jgi:hypothetical protein